MRIILIGFMGSGKTTLAKELASKLGYTYCDMDIMIEESENSSITTLFENVGEPYFRGLETELLKSLSVQENIVIASGGGAPCSEENIKLISDNFISIFLDVEKDLLLKRLKLDYRGRPLLTNASNLDQEIETRLQLRRKYYEAATHTIRINEDNESTILDKVLNTIRNE